MYNQTHPAAQALADQQRGSVEAEVALQGRDFFDLNAASDLSESCSQQHCTRFSASICKAVTNLVFI